MIKKNGVQKHRFLKMREFLDLHIIEIQTGGGVSISKELDHPSPRTLSTRCAARLDAKKKGI
jgi:hypothetical protein